MGVPIRRWQPREARRVGGSSERDLDAWLAPFLSAMGRNTRRIWAPPYLRGLLGPGERKSLQPMAARLGLPGSDRLQHFIAGPARDDGPLRRELARAADRLVSGSGACPVIDDTALPEKGTRSVGVARQYCGALGEKANCQSPLSLKRSRRGRAISARSLIQAGGRGVRARGAIPQTSPPFGREAVAPPAHRLRVDPQRERRRAHRPALRQPRDDQLSTVRRRARAPVGVHSPPDPEPARPLRRREGGAKNAVGFFTDPQENSASGR